MQCYSLEINFVVLNAGVCQLFGKRSTNNDSKNIVLVCQMSIVKEHKKTY